MKSSSAVNLLLSVCVLMNVVLQISGFNIPKRYNRISSLKSIAPYKTPRAQNAPGNLFVDEGKDSGTVML